MSPVAQKLDENDLRSFQEKYTKIKLQQNLKHSFKSYVILATDWQLDYIIEVSVPIKNYD